MTYNELIAQIDKAKADNEHYYGDFGFDFRLEWNDCMLKNIEVTWPALESNAVEDTYCFAEALQSFCFFLNRYVGTVVDE